jgi:FAD dependent monooxygenase
MTQPDSSSKPFRIVIVGGGIVGLTLSHALQLADIDHVVLEKHREIVSLMGAALIVWPGMARVLDQFGLLDKIVATTSPITSECNRWPDGTIANKHQNMQTLSKM